MIDPGAFTTPFAGPDPSGPNLEYDPDFLALDRAQQGRPEQVIGDNVKPREDPNWPDVLERAAALLGRTRDLRVAVCLTLALLQTDGVAGLAAGLAVIKGLLQGLWETVHPQLDADDANDPTARVNALTALASPEGLLKALRESPVVWSKTLGRFSLRDIRIASGKLTAAAGAAAPPPQQISGAFFDAPLTELQAAAAAIGSALSEINDIDRLLIDKVGALAPEFKPLMLDLTELDHVFAEHLTARGGKGGAAAPGAEPAISGAGAQPGAGGGVVATREDVIRQLDGLCDYYRRHEPSSPIPLLLQRARRLVAKDFMAIIRDLTPSGVAEAESIGGVEKNDG